MARGNLLFALEEIAQEVVDTEDSQSVMEVSAAEVAAQEAEVTQYADDIDTAGAEVQTLQKTQDVVAQTVECGEGMSEDAAQITQVVVESIFTKLNLTKNYNLIPAVESFGSSNSRLAASKIALENIGEVVKKIWTAIINGIKTMVQKVTEFFQTLFSNIGSIKKAAEAMKKKAEEIKGKTSDVKEIENSAMAKAFTVDGKVDLATASKVFKMHAIYTKGAVLGSQTVDKVLSVIDKVINTKDADADKMKNDVRNVVEPMMEFLEKTSKMAVSGAGVLEDIKGLPEGQTGKVSKVGPYFGGNFITTSLVIDKNEVPVSFKIEYTAGESKAAKDAKLKVLSYDDINNICDAVTELMADTEAYKKHMDSWKKDSANMIKAGDSIMKVLENNAKDKPGVSAVLAGLRRIFTDTFTVSHKMFTKMPGWNVALSKAALNYAGASIAAYKGEAVAQPVKGLPAPK